MKAKQQITLPPATLSITARTVCWGCIAAAEISKEPLDSIKTPNEVYPSIGTLKFFDGAPLPETAEKAKI